MPFDKNINVQSFCFRGFKDNAKVAEMVKQIGAAQIEVCGVHVDFNDESTFDAAIGAYKNAGVPICAIGVELITTDEAAVRKRFNFCRKAGVKHMSVNFRPEDGAASFRLAEKLADEFDMKLGIHNHGGYHWLGSTMMLKHVFNTTSKRIGLYLDTAWAMQTGEDVFKFIDVAGDRLFGVHIKDFTFDRAGKWHDVVSGTGNLDLPKLAATLQTINFTGPTVIEYEADVNNPVPALTQCVQALRAVK